MRISRALALAGVDSRRKCETYVLNGAVRVNDTVVRDLAAQVDPEKDIIYFRGRALPLQASIYYILNKPTGYVSTAHDPHAKKTVFDLLPRRLVRATRNPANQKTRVFPVGRLDKNSTGIMLFTNDGDLANRLLHPRYEVPKCYEVRLDRAFEMPDKKTLLDGIRLREGKAKVEKLRPLSKRILQVILREGKNREVRRLFEALNYEVVRLARVSFGPIELGQLRLGGGRYLTKTEITMLKKAANSKRG